ncbi:hypothetical protein HELRODRAFT_146235, partial [Helobdella robusta]|uniref:RecA family profile 1 domain-containing protein n=1 Tax=Helobdella robusta TaxID=6412 RepID=T1EJR1_HELRO
LMSKKLRCLGFDKGLVESLTRHGLLCCKDVLNKSAVELMMMLKISIQTSTYIIEKASEACKPLHLTALDLLEKNKFNSFLMTSLKPLDDVLKGGLLFSSITEIAGPPGCGKTQFCFMLSV